MQFAQRGSLLKIANRSSKRAARIK
jgi:hypothetical protein